MSLILRRDCQPLLDGVGLNNYHVAIDTDVKAMRIVGECGQRLVLIRGITFSRTTPSLAEVEYAVELLNAFLIKHGAAITQYVKARQSFLQKDEPPMKGDDWQITKTEKFSLKNRLHKIRYRDKDFEITMDSNNWDNFVSVEVDKSINPKEFNKMKLDMQLLKLAKTMLSNYYEWYVESVQLKELAKQIETCEI